MPADAIASVRLRFASAPPISSTDVSSDRPTCLGDTRGGNSCSAVANSVFQPKSFPVQACVARSAMDGDRFVCVPATCSVAADDVMRVTVMTMVVTFAQVLSCRVDRRGKHFRRPPERLKSNCRVHRARYLSRQLRRCAELGTTSRNEKKSCLCSSSLSRQR